MPDGSGEVDARLASLPLSEHIGARRRCRAAACHSGDAVLIVVSGVGLLCTGGGVCVSWGKGRDTWTWYRIKKRFHRNMRKIEIKNYGDSVQRLIVASWDRVARHACHQIRSTCNINKLKSRPMSRVVISGDRPS